MFEFSNSSYSVKNMSGLSTSLLSIREKLGMSVSWLSSISTYIFKTEDIYLLFKSFSPNLPEQSIMLFEFGLLKNKEFSWFGLSALALDIFGGYLLKLR